MMRLKSLLNILFSLKSIQNTVPYEGFHLMSNVKIKKNILFRQNLVIGFIVLIDFTVLLPVRIHDFDRKMMKVLMQGLNTLIDMVI